ncbi:MAG TPA: FAD-linked oxidase C-terminal domain-containing protein [Solirubrobacteraceae bacterium]|jgi:glycolate oxidase subunit GlcD|nr:FAD-linked oxidase C-terminal domain-containing protein [Solirubrobacteraceae bacterium]
MDLAPLRAIVGAEHVLAPVPRAYREDASASRGISGSGACVVRPVDAEQVAAVVAHCYERGIAIVPRGGGSGFSGGAVAAPDEVVLSLERLNRVRALEPERWRMHVEAGVTTATVQRLARENGCFYPPDPGAPEQSQIGGNLATNAGGPHTFKYGVTRSWVTGVEAVLAPGELVQLGGPLRKDAAGYDLRGLLIGSEGTLGVITAAWLRLVPAPESAAALLAAYPDTAAGTEALSAVLGSGVVPAVLEYLDGGAVRAAAGAFPGELAGDPGLVVIAEVDGSEAEVAAAAGEIAAALAPRALSVHEFRSAAELQALWRWRGGASLAVTAQRGGKLSEDICVPIERLGEAIEATLRIGARHDLEACSWGHAGDGNLHSTFLLDPGDAAQQERAKEAAHELFELALALGGTISGEHGIGLAKSGWLRRQWAPAAIAAHEAVKQALDPRGLFNPGKKQP